MKIAYSLFTNLQVNFLSPDHTANLTSVNLITASLSLSGGQTGMKIRSFWKNTLNNCHKIQ